MKNLRGTALYCGIGNTIEEIEEHIKEAASVGINAIFTSLQLPEADKGVLLRDFPKMAEIAHRYGMVIDADLSERSAVLFGLDLHDFKAFKKMGVDYVRLDYGFTDQDIVMACSDRAAHVGNTSMKFVAKVIDNESFSSQVTQNSIKVVNAVFVFIIPLLIVALGIVIFIRRRNAR